MDDLDIAAAFVRARLDEDEQLARAAHPITSATALRWKVKPYERRIPGAGLTPTRVWGVVVEPRETIMADTYEISSYVADHIARHNPARTLADIKAKRELLAIWETTRDDGDRPHPLVTRLPYVLASNWPKHRDFKETWR